MPEEFTTHQLEQMVQCKSGWSGWVNQDRAPPSKTKTRPRKTDIEPLPTLLVLSKLRGSSYCDISQMVDIQCRTVKTHSPYKKTGLDVECSLERGLVCESSVKGKPCPDFEIRVKCNCGGTEEKVANYSTELGELEETGGKIMAGACPPGMREEPCAIQCDSLCVYYSYVLQEQGKCLGGTKCEKGCVSAEKEQFCPNGMFWVNEHTCVSVDECLCVSSEGNPLKPGQIDNDEEECKKCQCIDNSYDCKKYPCENEEEENRGLGLEKLINNQTAGVNLAGKPTLRPFIRTTPVEELFPTLAPILIPSSVTPPPSCDEDRFMDLVQGDQPLPDEAFNASSYLDSSFAPSHARLEGILSEQSGGSWAPKYSNQDQYLQVDLGRQEPVYGVIVRGSPLYDEYVTSYKVMYSPDGHTFYYILNKENYPVIFRGSVDQSTPVKQVFDTPVEAKVIRINPQTWNNGISLRVELIGCGEEKSTTPSYEIITVTTTKKPQYCDDPMGLGDGTMQGQQVSTSSELSPEHGKQHLKLNDTSSWQPFVNSPTEWVQFDFLEPRNITGLVTRGGENGWVTAFKIKYSDNNKDWNPILDETLKEKIFLGNYDDVSPRVNNFDIPISARYLKIIPTKWNENIQLRLEIHGCYKPYPIIEEEVLTTPVPQLCNYCPGIVVLELEMDACRCLADLWWDGENCVNRTMCPCLVGHIPYAVGAVYEKEDCSECVCKLGGVSYCTPKKCDKCKEGLRSTVTGTCACTCQPCPENTILCPTSDICINSTLWCNGVQNCPDDEINCPTTTTAVEIIVPATETSNMKQQSRKRCPVVNCQPGYKKVEPRKSRAPWSTSYLSPMISGQSKTKARYSGLKTATKGGIKGGVKGYNRQNLQRPEPAEIAKEEAKICKEYICVSTKNPPKYIVSKDECPPIICQANYIPVYEPQVKSSSKNCPRYSCYPPPEPDAVCNVTGRTFNTFDNVEYKYDICNHVLARDLENNEWDVSLKKNCSTSCSRDLIIQHQDNLFILHPDLSVEFDGYRYTIDQIKSIGLQNQAFEITQLGNTLLFVSKRYGFWVIWNTLADVKLGVVHKLEEKVDGLCGFFNDEPSDDKRKPDGSSARTSVEFGDSWALANDQPLICEAKACPIHIQNKAWEMCNRIKEQSLSPCAKVVDIEAFISRCLETTCTCLQHSLDKAAEEECRCQSMQSFVVDCLSADSTVDISDWRMQQDCPTTCEAPLVYHDCYQRKCEPTCESISDPNVCPKVNNVCFPGCYCPPGHVRKDETCIKPSSCRDCECNVLPHLQYITYDENNFTISGNCVYVMSRDVVPNQNDEHKFQVLVTNHPCQKNKDRMCVGKVTILYQGHKIHVLRDNQRRKLKLIVDSERIEDFSEVAPWLLVRETATKHLKLLLADLQVEVSVYYPSLGLSVKAPSHKYGGKLEGLCGDCNGDIEDDFKTPTGEKPKDMADFGLSWLYENLPGGQTREQCENKPEEECPPLPVDSDPCLQLVDVNKFGQCLNVMDPTIFLEWCKKDTCGGHQERACVSIEAYAKDCASAGFCINWRNEYCPALKCPPDQFYDPCGASHPETCDSIKENTKTVKKSIPTEGCYCPEGKVLLNDTCVFPKDCEVCDSEGHHPGDIWQNDKCTICTCEGTSLKCETQSCPGISTICETGYNPIKVPTSEEQCCDKYACVPEPTSGPTCEPPQPLVCGPGQVTKLNTKPNGCQAFVCECKPADECEPVDLTTDAPLEPGYVKEVDTAGCCPLVTLVCKKELCPGPNECPQYNLLKKENIEGLCCPLYWCEPPEDKCIYDMEYTVADQGGERPLGKFEKQKLLKPAEDTWRDGPCRECKCVNTTSGKYQPTCSQTECPSIMKHADYDDYELIPDPVFEQCCPNIKRVACKHNGKTYKVGETWPKGADYCTTMKCVDQKTGIQKETEVKSCDKKCDLGFEYIPATPESKQCCGSCKPVACVMDGIVHAIGEEWTSADHCTNFFCQNINGSLQVQAVLVNCPKLPEDYLKEFTFETFPVDGECCSKHVPTACKVGDKIYKVGEIWPSPDGDKCKTFKCVKKNSQELTKEVIIESCKKECLKGREYKESNKTCCGECVQVACVVDGEIKTPNESWTSPDNCTTYSCEQIDDQFVISSQQEFCPSVSDCPEDKIYFKDCCKRCNLTSADQKRCIPESITLDKTIGILNFTGPTHGRCTNKQPIPNFTECVGSCPSSTLFSTKSGLHESECFCCQATDYTSISVELHCSDGETFSKKIAVPSKCGCEGCAANKSSFTKSATKSGVKNVKTARGG